MGLGKRIKDRNFTDVRMQNLLALLSKSKTKFWKSVAKRLSTPRNNRAAVNIDKLNRNFQKGMVLVVPGKVLGSGQVEGKMGVAAYSFSQKAVEKIEGAGGKIMTLEELFESNPKGKKVKMVI